MNKDDVHYGLAKCNKSIDSSLCVSDRLLALGTDGNQLLNPSLPAFGCIVARAEHGRSDESLEEQGTILSF